MGAKGKVKERQLGEILHSDDLRGKNVVFIFSNFVALKYEQIGQMLYAVANNKHWVPQHALYICEN